MKPLSEYDAQSIISEELIEEIFEEEDEIKRAYMIADLSLRAKELKVASANIVKVCKKERKNTKGYTFEYIKEIEQ